MRFNPGCSCCGGTGPCGCCALDGDYFLNGVTATVTLLSGSLPWDIEGAFTLAPNPPGCRLVGGITGSPFGTCVYAINFACFGDGPPGCAGYTASLQVGTVGGFFTCFLVEETPFGECECDPLNVVFRFSIVFTVVLGDTCNLSCGAEPGDYTAEVELVISPL